MAFYVRRAEACTIWRLRFQHIRIKCTFLRAPIPGRKRLYLGFQQRLAQQRQRSPLAALKPSPPIDNELAFPLIPTAFLVALAEKGSKDTTTRGRPFDNDKVSCFRFRLPTHSRSAGPVSLSVKVCFQSMR